jgi:hypothetical protein
MKSKMTPKRPTPKSAVIDRYWERFQELKAELGHIEYFSKGTVLARMIKCGKPQCACRTKPSKRHGPYYEWTLQTAGQDSQRAA